MPASLFIEWSAENQPQKRQKETNRDEQTGDNPPVPRTEAEVTEVEELTWSHGIALDCDPGFFVANEGLPILSPRGPDPPPWHPLM